MWRMRWRGILNDWRWLRWRFWRWLNVRAQRVANRANARAARLDRRRDGR